MTIICESRPQLQPTTAERAKSAGVRATKLPRSRAQRVRGEKHFAALAEATGQLVWTARPDGAAIEARAWSAFTGLEEERVLGWGWLQTVHADDRTRTERYWKHAIASGVPFELECRVRRDDGAYRWLAVRAVPVRDASDVIEWVSAAADVTDRRQHEGIFDAMADAVVVFDEAGTILRANAADREMLGIDTTTSVPPRTLVERGQWLMPRDEHCKLLPRQQWPAFRVLRGEDLRGNGAMELKVRTADGRTLEVSESGAPLRDTSGRIVGGVLVVRDVTERRALEHRTRETLHALLDMAEVLVGQVAAAGTSTTSDTSAVIRRLGELARSVLGCKRLSITALEAGTDRPIPLLRVGCPARMEQRWNAHEGSGRLRDYVPDGLIERLRMGEVVVNDPAHTTPPDCPARGGSLLLLAPLRIESQLIGFLSLDYGERQHQYITDERLLAGAVAQLAAVVIERERLLREREEARASELASREATRRMELFIAMASHEFRTPLTVIKGYLQFAQQLLGPRLPSGEIPAPINRTLVTACEALTLASGAAARMSGLLDDFLQVSRAQAGKLLVRPQRCDLGGIVRASVDELRQMNSTRQVCLRIPANRPAYVNADPERIGQVVTNYLTNALNFSPEDQPVDVRVHVRRHIARVSVRDRGPGLPAADKKRIWERFYQAPGVERQAGTDAGLGLGLYVCRMIIEQHGGRVGVESTVGQGATFWFTLPLNADGQ